MNESAFPLRHQRTAEFAAIPSAARAARREVVQTLKDWSLLELVDIAELLVSELVTNAVHATGLPHDPRNYGDLKRVPRILLQVQRTPAGLWLLVWDRDPRPPVPREVSVDDEGGRGLQLVSTLSRRWGHYRPPYGGKVVWAEVVAE